MCICSILRSINCLTAHKSIKTNDWERVIFCSLSLSSFIFRIMSWRLTQYAIKKVARRYHDDIWWPMISDDFGIANLFAKYCMHWNWIKTKRNKTKNQQHHEHTRMKKQSCTVHTTYDDAFFSTCMSPSEKKSTRTKCDWLVF